MFELEIYEIFYILLQLRLDNRKIKEIFYENHVKLFVSQINYLALNEVRDNSFEIYQSLRKFKRKKKIEEISLFFS